MTLVYTLVFGITIAELVLLLLLLLPLGESFQSRFFSFLYMIQTRLRIGIYVMFSFVFILFINSVNTSMRGNDTTTSHPTIFDPYSHCKIFYAQRNIYLTFITLMAGIILYRIPQMLSRQTTPIKSIIKEN
jgi:hypothetical protein